MSSKRKGKKKSKSKSIKPVVHNVVDDSRFKHVHSDPRFQRLPQRQKKFKVDKRFNKMFKDKEFQTNYLVDQYGRKIKREGKEDIKKFYEIDESDEDEESSDDVPDMSHMMNMVSSEDDSDLFSDDLDEEEEEIVVEQPQVRMGDISQATTRLAVVNMEWDRIKAVDLLVLFSSFLGDAGNLVSVNVYPSDYGLKRMEEEKKFGPAMFRKDQETKETADGTKVEEKNINQTTKTATADDADADEDNSDEDEDEEDSDEPTMEDLFEQDEGEAIDQSKLRLYELERLKYFYAIVECDCKRAAMKLYNECDGTEFESSANTLDLQFVPDGTTFDTPPRDTATSVPATYKPCSIFTTKALQHTKVNLTWDETDPIRREMLRKENAADMDDDDLNVYLASDNDDGAMSDAVVETSGSEGENNKVVLKRRARARYAGLLSGLKADEDDEDEEEIEIKWQENAKLQHIGAKILEKLHEDKEEKTIWGKVLEKRKQKKKLKKKAYKEAQKKAADKAARGGDDSSDDADVDDDDLLQDGSEGEDYTQDPFFADAFDDDLYEEPVKKEKKPKKKDKKRKREEEEAATPADDSELKELELLMGDADNTKGYSLKRLLKSHQDATGPTKKKRKKKKKGAADNEESVPDDFSVNTLDPRFQRVFNDPSFHIDPTNPAFKNTAGTTQLMEESQNRQRKRAAKEEASARKRKAEFKATGSATSGGSAAGGSSAVSSDLAALIGRVKKHANKQHKNKQKNKTVTTTAPAIAAAVATSTKKKKKKKKKKKQVSKE